MKILLFIAFVIVGSSEIFARPDPTLLEDDSLEYEDYMEHDPNMSLGPAEENDDVKDDVAFELPLGDYDGFEKYWSKPIAQLYVEEDDSNQATDTTSSEEMPWNGGKEFVFKQDEDDEYVFVDKDSPPDTVMHTNLLSSDNEGRVEKVNSQADDSKVVAKKEISSATEPLNFQKYYAYQLTADGKDDTSEEGTELKGNSDSDKSEKFVALEWNDGKEFVFIADVQEQSDESGENDVVPIDQTDVQDNDNSGNDIKDFLATPLDKIYYSGVNMKFYDRGYPRWREDLAALGWNEGKEFDFKTDLTDESDETNIMTSEEEEEDDELTPKINTKLFHTDDGRSILTKLRAYLGWKDSKDIVITENNEAARNEQHMENMKDELYDEDDDNDEVKEDDEENQENYVNEENEQDAEEAKIERSASSDFQKEGDEDNKDDKVENEQDEEEAKSKRNPSSNSHKNIDPLLTQLAFSTSNSDLLVEEHKINVQDFVVTQKHLSDALTDLNAQNELIFEKFFSTDNERYDYNGQLHRDIERDMNEMLRTVDQIKGRINELQQIEQKHDYYMLLNALLKELNGKSQTL